MRAGMNVRWTTEAFKDLDEIENFIALDNPERAYTFIEELLDFGDSLGEFAYKGTQAKWTKETKPCFIAVLSFSISNGKIANV